MCPNCEPFVIAVIHAGDRVVPLHRENAIGDEHEQSQRCQRVRDYVRQAPHLGGPFEGAGLGVAACRALSARCMFTSAKRFDSFAAPISRCVLLRASAMASCEAAFE